MLSNELRCYSDVGAHRGRGLHRLAQNATATHSERVVAFCTVSHSYIKVQNSTETQCRSLLTWNFQNKFLFFRINVWLFSSRPQFFLQFLESLGSGSIFNDPAVAPWKWVIVEPVDPTLPRYFRKTVKS